MTPSLNEPPANKPPRWMSIADWVTSAPSLSSSVRPTTKWSHLVDATLTCTSPHPSGCSDEQSKHKKSIPTKTSAKSDGGDDG